MKVRVQRFDRHFDLTSSDKYDNVDVKLSPYVKIKAIVVTVKPRHKDRSDLAFFNNFVSLTK